MIPQLARSVPLAPRTTLQVGGVARYWLEVDSCEALLDALQWARDEGIEVWLLGGGSNVLIADSGLPGLVLRIRHRQRSIVSATMMSGTIASGAEAARLDGDILLEVGAGHSWDKLVSYTVAQGWAGLECLSGIPGEVGAAPMQNVGAYGQEVSHTIAQVQLVERATGELCSLTNEQCQFAYRDSLFKRDAVDRYIVWSVRFRLRPGGAPLIAYPELERAVAETGKPTLAHIRDTVIKLRRRKSMVLDTADPNHRSAGSFFVNPIISAAQAAEVEGRAAKLLKAGQAVPRYAAAAGCVKLPAAWLIERAGMTKGYGDGPVGLSGNHTLAVVNRGTATAHDIIAFASHVRRRVFDSFGVSLSHEPRLLGFQPEDTDGLTAALAI